MARFDAGSTMAHPVLAHDAKSGGLDHERRVFRSFEVLTGRSGRKGFAFKNGSIFDRLRDNKIRWRVSAVTTKGF